jgi:hypothetical protein
VQAPNLIIKNSLEKNELPSAEATNPINSCFQLILEQISEFEGATLYPDIKIIRSSLNLFNSDFGKLVT